MKFIQTFFISSGKDPFKADFGWFSPYYHLQSWVLSALQLVKTNSGAQLYANKKAAGLLIDTLFLPDIVNDNQYQHLGEFHEAPCTKSYLHLQGHYKRDEYTCMQMSAKLQELYPDYYYRIIKLCHDKGMEYPHKKLYFSNLSTEQQFKVFSAKSTAVFINTHPLELLKRNSEELNPSDIKCVRILTDFLNNYLCDSDPEVSDDLLNSDFVSFSGSLIAGLNDLKYSIEYLYGRDLVSQKWFCSLFANSDLIELYEVVACSEYFILESQFDWAGIYNSLYRVGVGYYERMKVLPGNYFNLIVPEPSDYLVSLYDIDETEKEILKLLYQPQTIGSVLKHMEKFVVEEVIEKHYEAYRELIITFIKQLLVKKAIKPFKHNPIPIEK